MLWRSAFFKRSRRHAQGAEIKPSLKQQRLLAAEGHQPADRTAAIAGIAAQISHRKAGAVAAILMDAIVEDADSDGDRATAEVTTDGSRGFRVSLPSEYSTNRASSDGPGGEQVGVSGQHRRVPSGPITCTPTTCRPSPDKRSLCTRVWVCSWQLPPSRASRSRLTAVEPPRAFDGQPKPAQKPQLTQAGRPP